MRTYLNVDHVGNILYRVPTQIAFSNSLWFRIPCFFPVRWQIFPVPIYVINFVTITYTKLTLQTYLASKKQLTNIIPCFPVFWQNFQIPCFLSQGIFLAIFPVSPVQWRPWYIISDLLIFTGWKKMQIIFQKHWIHYNGCCIILGLKE